MKMKKRIFIFALFLAFCAGCCYADKFSDLLQDLAVQTACLGQYSMAQTGDETAEDPYDFYTPNHLAERFAKMSGTKTKTDTFYGVCFNYAEAAYKDISDNLSLYVDSGMENGEFYIAATNFFGNGIILYRPAKDGETPDQTMNGVALKKVREELQVTPHLDGNGKPAQQHAWLWVEKNDGGQYWVDPTWTDNVGFVVWGYVDLNNREIELECSPEYCADGKIAVDPARKTSDEIADENSGIQDNVPPERVVPKIPKQPEILQVKYDYSSLIVWGIITLAAALLAFGGYRLISNAARFESRKKEVAFGFASCALAVSAAFFLPVVLSKINLQLFGINLDYAIQYAKLNALKGLSKFAVPDFVGIAARFLASKSMFLIRLALFGIPTVLSVLAVSLIIKMIFSVREPKAQTDKEYNRNHLFEYNNEILENLNQKK